MKAAILTAALCGPLSSPAIAAGGAHVVDDVDVETPGRCHVETWVTEDQGHGLADLSPACTPAALQSVEIGAVLIHSWDGQSITTAGPAVKVNLRSTQKGIGLAASFGATWNLRSGRLDTASVTVPITFTVSSKTRFNLNLGYSYSATSKDRHSPFWGGQIETQLGTDLSAMVEGFGRETGPAGAQAGLRWNPGHGDLDVDLLVGRYVDGSSPRSATLGVTIRG
ncbi:hypothetical protein KRR38_03515 [Novosphingobium sp. G106]|uniref:hypothetical protein n=1 Tax=Novosphingobium sp. G106 TaxID=2849500 RepID=UPI001C2D6DDA|nr:hypothetical protein [Novosphingobium sp. G106]MBV1686763.1 hypothetical protein [Novosphingobium sp. G106]